MLITFTTPSPESTTPSPESTTPSPESTTPSSEPTPASLTSLKKDGRAVLVVNKKELAAKVARLYGCMQELTHSCGINEGEEPTFIQLEKNFIKAVSLPLTLVIRDEWDIWPFYEKNQHLIPLNINLYSPTLGKHIWGYGFYDHNYKETEALINSMSEEINRLKGEGLFDPTTALYKPDFLMERIKERITNKVLEDTITPHSRLMINRMIERLSPSPSVAATSSSGLVSSTLAPVPSLAFSLPLTSASIAAANPHEATSSPANPASSLASSSLASSSSTAVNISKSSLEHTSSHDDFEDDLDLVLAITNSYKTASSSAAAAATTTPHHYGASSSSAAAVNPHYYYGASSSAAATPLYHHASSSSTAEAVAIPIQEPSPLLSSPALALPNYYASPSLTAPAANPSHYAASTSTSLHHLAGVPTYAPLPSGAEPTKSRVYLTARRKPKQEAKASTTTMLPSSSEAASTTTMFPTSDSRDSSASSRIGIFDRTVTRSVARQMQRKAQEEERNRSSASTTDPRFFSTLLAAHQASLRASVLSNEPALMDQSADEATQNLK